VNVEQVSVTNANVTISPVFFWEGLFFSEEAASILTRVYRFRLSLLTLFTHLLLLPVTTSRPQNIRGNGSPVNCGVYDFH
jgi:hypothetical protein